jgi:RHS repeat-associated protein
MNPSNLLILSTSPLSQTEKKPRETASLTYRHRLLYRRRLRRHTGKERDSETGLYYYGARYLDSKTSRWLSGDPAMGEYVPSAPVDDEARKRNGSLSGQGGVFNYVNLHVYHYAGNNPVKLVDPDGRTNYRLSNSGVTLLKLLEGSVRNNEGNLIPYNDSNGNATKGYGILLHSGALTSNDIINNPPQTESEATAELTSVLAGYERIMNNRATFVFDENGQQSTNELSFTETQADALIILTFNSPNTALRVMNAIREGHSNEDVRAIWLGNNEGGLASRRAAEWALYSEGVYSDNPY